MFMHFRLALVALLALCSATVYGQDVEKDNSKGNAKVTKPSRDFLMMQLTYEGWGKKPDSIKLGSLNRGFNMYLCYDFPLAKSNFSFAAGVGIGTSNIYFDNQQVMLTDTGALGDQVRFINETTDYKKFKLTTAYLEAPFELRFFGNKENRNKGFKAAVGLRVGTLVGAHTKSRRTVEGTKLIEKENTKRYMETWRFAATARLGYGNFSLMGSYNLNTLYKAGLGPEITPYSVGICITGL